MVSKKASSIDEHLWKSVYGQKPRRLVRRTGLRYRMRDWSRVDEMFSLSGSGKFNPGMKMWAILFVILAFAIAIPIWAEQPGNGLFHNIQTNPASFCSPPGCDPDTVTQLWAANDPLGTGVDFQYNARASYDVNGLWASGRAVDLSPTGTGNTGYALALSKTSFDPSTVSGKHLRFFTFLEDGTITSWPNGFAVEMYLTRNSTLPTESGYNPRLDKNVALVFAATSGGTTWDTGVYLQKSVMETISGEDTGCSGSGSCFIDETHTRSCATGFQLNGCIAQMAFWLNFTGASAPLGNVCASEGTFPAGGSACSTIITTPSNTINAETGFSVQQQPAFQFQGQQYYVGLFADGQINGVIKWGLDDGNANMPNQIDPTGSLGSGIHSMQFGVAQIISTAPTIAPTIDTGGFFGPVIRALVAIGVFILSNIISFFVYLFGLVSGVLIAAFNAIGNGLGIGNLGSSLALTFGGIGSFIINVFGTIFAYGGNFATFISNGLSAIGQIISNYWTQATSGLSALQNWLSNAWTVIQAIGFWFKIGFSGFMFVWMLYGTILAFEDYNKWKLEWLNPTELFSVKLFGLTYWIGEKSFDLMWKGLQALKGWL